MRFVVLLVMTFFASSAYSFSYEEMFEQLDEINNISPDVECKEDSIQQAIKNRKIVILINKSQTGPTAQTLILYQEGKEIFRTKVSTGSEKNIRDKNGVAYSTYTPTGFFRPNKMYITYFSGKSGEAMENAVFFAPGIAIHATDNNEGLGKNISHGCIRVSKSDALFIREKVMESGKGKGADKYSTISTTRFAFGKKQTNRLILGNSIPVPLVGRQDGRDLQYVNSWDTVIIVYEKKD